MKITKKLLSVIITAALLLSCVMSFAGCDNGRYVKKDVTYHITTFTVMDMDIMMINGLSTEESYVTLRKDGTCTIRITPNSSIIAFANNLLKGVDLSNFDVTDFITTYLSSFFPGFLPSEIEAGFAIVKEDMGVEIIGLNSDNPQAAGLIEALEAGYIPENLSIPTNLAIEINTYYYMETVHSDYSGDYQGVFVGRQYDKDNPAQPYIIMTMFTDEEGNDCIKTTFEILSADIVGIA